MHTGHWLNLTDRKETTLATQLTIIGAGIVLLVPVMSLLLLLGLADKLLK